MTKLSLTSEIVNLLSGQTVAVFLGHRMTEYWSTGLRNSAPPLNHMCQGYMFSKLKARKYSVHSSGTALNSDQLPSVPWLARATGPSGMPGDMLAVPRSHAQASNSGVLPLSRSHSRLPYSITESIGSCVSGNSSTGVALWNLPRSIASASLSCSLVSGS